MKLVWLALLLIILSACQTTHVEIYAWIDSNSTLRVDVIQPKTVSTTGTVPLSLIPGI
jgi:hypothetical protein